MVVSGQIEVLHVDDQPDLADLTATSLHRENDQLTVQTATSASDGLTAVAQNGFDCIVSDFEMPGQNGLEFLRAVRETEPALPFILFTGKGSEEVASEAIAAGVTDYLQKESGSSQYKVLANRIINAVHSQRATERAEDTEEWARTLLEYSSDYVFVVDGQGEITYCSPSIARVLGYDPDEITGTGAFEYIHPDDVETAVEAFTEIIERPNEDVSVEFRAKHSTGGHRWLEVRGRNLADDSVIEGTLVNARDITERKEQEQALRDVKEEYQSVFEAAHEAIFLFDVVRAGSDVEFKLRRLNPAHEAISGFSSEADSGKTTTELLGEQQGAEVAAHFRRCLHTREKISYHEELDMATGTIHWHTKLSPVIDEGKVTQIVGVAREISEETTALNLTTVADFSRN